MILKGDALSMLQTLPDASVQCIVSSPPYWALRKYDIPDIVFDGDPGCEHEWTEQRAPFANAIPGPNGAVKNRVDRQQEVGKVAGAFCRCGAWRGQLGQEPTPDLFIAHMVEIFREARRVLRADGVMFLNMGDCYAGRGCGGNPTDSPHQKQATNRGSLGASARRGARANGSSEYTLKPKDLVGIPWMLAFALRADGWHLRAEIVWVKGMSFCPSYAGSVMPESVTDRPTRSHEQVFLLTKSERYFYDHEAVKEKGVYQAGPLAAKGSGTREGNRRGPRKKDIREAHKMAQREDGNHPWDGYAEYDGKRNMRTVWAIGVEPYSEAHFATFPPGLVDPCLRAGTSQKGACASCGAPWKRVVEYDPLPDNIKAQFDAARSRTAGDHGRDDGFTTRKPNYQRTRKGETWEPTCECGADVVPCVVLDPFAGSGTTGEVCELMRLKFIGIDLGYHELSARRIGSVAPLFTEAVS